MQNFIFNNPTKIIFGKDIEKDIGKEVARYSKRILLHYGGGSIKRGGLYDKVITSLKNNGIYFSELGGVQPNPRLSLVHQGIQTCRDNNLNFILAVGGGSTIDSAKAIALGVPYEGDVWDFYFGGSEPESALSVGAVLTIPAAGSESSNSSVITKEEGGLKRSCGTDLLYPRFAFLNPEANFTLPPYQTACGASDIIAHLMERYFTQVEHVDFTDRLIEQSIRTILHYAPLAIAHPDNYDYRAEILWCGAIAHNNLLSTGRVGDWGSHEIEHELSGMYDIAHGAGLSIIFPAWMKYVWKDNPRRFMQFAMRVFDVDYSLENEEPIVLEGIARLERFYRLIGLPTRLSDVKIPEDSLRKLSDKCLLGRDHVGNFKKLTSADVYAILQLSL